MAAVTALTRAPRALVHSLQHHGLRDHSLALLRDGYRFGERRRRNVEDDLVRLRLMGRRAVVVRGEEAARFFYTEPAMRRADAVPYPLARSLFGRGAVHGLDAGHRHRKALFTSILDAPAAREMAALTIQRWEAAEAHWRGEIDLFTEVARILFGASCAWVGAQVAVHEEPARTKDMIAMVDGFGSLGPRHLRAHLARHRTEAWMTDQIEAARRRDRSGPSTPLERIAAHLEQDGRPLPSSTAAVETLNLIRPTVAVSWLVAMAAVAMDHWPGLRTAVLDGSVEPMEFAQEVRRYYPFVPVLAARPAEAVHFKGQRVAAGTLVVLDVWGTNHDPRLWREPMSFDPTRFREEPITPYNLVPQGGGSAETGHRCPGEDVTLAIISHLTPRLARLGLASVNGSTVGLRRMPPAPVFPMVVGAR